MATAKAKAAEGGFLSKVKRPFQNIARFLREVWNELQRVVWPTHEDTKGFTVVVMVAVAIVAVWVGFFDFFFAQIVGMLERL
jgi:preprotein translocase subunit SecE